MFSVIHSFIRYILFSLYFLTFGLITLIGFFILPINFAYKLIKPFCRGGLIALGVNAKVVGSIPNKGTFIVMMHHSSFIDSFIFPLLIKGKFTGIADKKNFSYPIYSQILKRIRAVSIDRSNRIQSIRGIEKAEKILKEGYHIGILPEGTRTTDGKVKRLKKGGFHMAVNTQTPIIPVGVKGAFEFKPKTRWTLKPGKVVLTVGAPTNPDDYEVLGVNGLLEKIQKEIERLST